MHTYYLMKETQLRQSQDIHLSH